MSPLIEAAKWVEALLLGQVGTVVAILALAWVGALMLQGRLALRTGLRVVMGCFILFGAPIIAKGLAGVTRSSVGEVVYPEPDRMLGERSVPEGFDPYAGAAAPM